MRSFYDIDGRPNAHIGAYASGGGAKVNNSPTIFNITINICDSTRITDATGQLTDAGKLLAFFRAFVMQSDKSGASDLDSITEVFGHTNRE